MVNYTYRNLFYKSHQTKDILIVDAGATVTPVTNQAPTVSGATVEIHTADLVSESFALDESLCSEEHLKFGLCEAAKCSFSIRNTQDIPLLKKDDPYFLNVYIYFNGNSDTLFQIGQYICDKDEYSINRKQRNVTLYDILYLAWDLDVTSVYNNLYSNASSITIKTLRDALISYVATKTGLTSFTQETTTLINDTLALSKTIESDSISFGFLMQNLLEANGVFGHIDRTGKFVYKSLVTYDNPSVATVTDDFRKPPTQYTDYTTQGIAYVVIYDQNNLEIGRRGSTNLSRPSIYNIVDNFVFDRHNKALYRLGNFGTVLTALRNKITHLRYKSCEVECVGDLTLEVGDKIDVQYDENGDGVTDTFYTFILSRHFRGLGSMHDTYSSKGEPRQPDYQITNESWHIGDSDTSATNGQGSGGVSEVNDEHDRRMIELMRNYGERLLDEPTVSLTYDKANNQVEIIWSDPNDISAFEPVPCYWDSTVVVRKEDTPPLNIWDGTILVTETVKDTYSETAFVDDTIQSNKRYYYGIFPCHVALDDEYHPIKHYRWTKVISVDTQRILVAPTIYEPLSVSGVNVTVTFSIPALDVGSYSSIKLVAKKNNIPTDVTDANKTVNLSASDTTATVTGLDETSHYYFVIFVEDNIGNTASSVPEDCTTSVDAGTIFDYTGEIQTFTAPRTGTYQLETWGAQGGDATDGTNTANGGYGAYAVGEILLTQGDVLYINVGGQNGYNGGGMKVWDGSEIDIIWSGQNNKLTAQIDNSTIVFTMYTGASEIYSFTSQVGTGVGDTTKINASFLIDSTNQVAKPSFIYDNGDTTYTYNAEEPTDSEMADIYTWISAGLSS